MNKEINKIVKELTNEKSLEIVYHSPVNNELMPSHNELKEVVDLLRKIIFPGYFGNASVNNNNIEYYIGVNINNVLPLLKEQIKRGLFFDCSNNKKLQCDKISEQADKITLEFVKNLPEIRKKLSTDVIAAYLGDPAAKGYGEVIFCYPVIRALTNYRLANLLLKLNVPLIPRIITEMAHSETGIDIHPGAEIGEYFTIDHGTGVVIGETTIIGKNVKIYQGVTLGAKSFPLDENGNPIKGIARHPIVKDNVVIYAEATILGRVTIGENSIIGGNMWITHDIKPNSKILQR